MPPDTLVYHWDFRIVRPTFMAGDEPKLLEALEPEVTIRETTHQLLGITNLAFEEDVRNTVFSAITQPTSGPTPPTLQLLRWPTPAFARMLFGTTPIRELVKDGALGQRRHRRAVVDHNRQIIGVAITLEDLFNRESS